MRCMIAFSAFLCLFGWAPLSREAQMYLWTDRDGNIHITDDLPPAEAQLHDILEYTLRSRLSKDED